MIEKIQPYSGDAKEACIRLCSEGGENENMILSRARIRGYRSIKDCVIIFRPFQVLLGPNNAGKSNILSALEFFFEAKTRLSPQDFYQSEDKIQMNEFSVEATFSNLADSDKQMFSRYVLPDGTMKVIKISKLEDGVPSSPEYHGVTLKPKDCRYYAETYEGTPTECFAKLEEEFGDISKFRPEGRVSKGLFEDTLQNIVESRRNELEFEEVVEKSLFMGWKNVASGRLGHFIPLRAVSDPSAEARVAGGSYIKKLLDIIYNDIAERSEEYTDVLTRLKEVVAKFNRLLQNGSPNPTRPEQLTQLERKIADELSDWDVDVEFIVHPPNIMTTLLSPEVCVDDGYKSTLDLKGQGLQRSFIFAMMNVWKESLLKRTEENGDIEGHAKLPIIIAIEEPELYLHPQKQRTLNEILHSLSSTERHQVIVTSHSPVFIDLNYPLSIFRLQKTKEKGTEIFQLKENPFEGDDSEERKKRFNLTYWINPARGELFFASRVVLVEGSTEEVAIPYAAKKLGIFRHDVTLVNCGGKRAIPLYQDLLNAFGLDYFIVHDEDPITVETGDDKYKSQRHTFELNQIIKDKRKKEGRIEICSPDFEGISRIPKAQKDKKGALASIEYLEENTIPQDFETLLRGIYG